VYSVEGQKVTMMRANPSVCFEVDQYLPGGGWRSVIIQGTYEELSGDDAGLTLRLLADRFASRSAMGAGSGPGRGSRTGGLPVRAAEITGRKVERSLPPSPSVVPGLPVGRQARRAGRE